MKRIKKILILLCVIFMAAGTAVGCSGKNSLSPAENSVEEEFVSDYNGPNDPSIIIDGVLDESVYADKKWFRNTFAENLSGNMPVLQATGFTTEYGLYIAAQVWDENIVYSGQFMPSRNSAFDLYFVIGDEDRLDDDSLDRYHLLVDMGLNIMGTPGRAKRGAFVQGEINSGETEFATLEVFYSWGQLGVDISEGVPEGYGLWAEYKAVLPGQSSVKTVSTSPGPGKHNKNFYRIGKDGYSNQDAENAVLGDAKSGFAKTANWDISRESEGIVSVNGGEEWQTIYFRDAYDENFTISTDLQFHNSLNNDYPHAGLYIRSTEGYYISVVLAFYDDFLTTAEDGGNTVKNFELVTIDNSTQTWRQRAVYRATNTDLSSSVLSLKLIKRGSELYYFINGNYCMTERADWLIGDAFAGFYTLGAATTFSNYLYERHTQEQAVQALNDEGIYTVTAEPATAGGSVETSAYAVKSGESADIRFVTQEGYSISSVQIDGIEKIEQVKESVKDGVYTLTGIRQNTKVLVGWSRLDNAVTYKGMIMKGEEPVAAELTLVDAQNPLNAFRIAVTPQNGFDILVPAGIYKRTVSAENCIPLQDEIDLSTDKEGNIVLQESAFVRSVTVNGIQVSSELSAWDMKEETDGYIYGDFALGNKRKPLYFAEVSKQATLSATVTNVTDYSQGGEYQDEPYAGFCFTDGTNTGHIFVAGQSVVYRGLNNNTGLVWDWAARKVLETPVLKEKNDSVELLVAIGGGMVHVYVGGDWVLSLSLTEDMQWTNYSEDMDLAYGLYMSTDKQIRLQYSDPVMSKEAAEVTERENSAFVSKQDLNDATVWSESDFWDVSNESESVTGYAYKTSEIDNRMKPLYFRQTANEAILEATITNAMSYSADSVNEKNPYGGFFITDGTNGTHLLISGKNLTYRKYTETGYSNWATKKILDENLLISTATRKSFTLRMVVSNGMAHILVDGQWLTSLSLTAEVGWKDYDSSKPLAYSLYVSGEGQTALQFTNISLITGAAAQAEIDAFNESLFVSDLQLNGISLTSAMNEFEVINDGENTTVTATCVKATRKQPLYFKATGNTALVSATISNKMDYSADSTYEENPYGGFYFTDGENYGHIMVTGKVISFRSYKSGGAANDWGSKTVLSENVLVHAAEESQRTVKLQLGVQGSNLYVFINGVCVCTLILGEDVFWDVSASEKPLAFGLYISGEAYTQLEYSDISIATESDAEADLEDLLASGV